MWLFLTVPWVGLQCVIVVFPDHTTYFFLFFYDCTDLVLIEQFDTGFLHLTLKAQRKNALKMSSAEVVGCKLSPYITDELSIEANSVDPVQTAPIRAV